MRYYARITFRCLAHCKHSRDIDLCYYRRCSHCWQPRIFKNLCSIYNLHLPNFQREFSVVFCFVFCIYSAKIRKWFMIKLFIGLAKRSFGFLHTIIGKVWMTFLVNPLYSHFLCWAKELICCCHCYSLCLIFGIFNIIYMVSKCGTWISMWFTS